MRAASKEATVVLKAPRKLSLEAAIEYIEDDELVEITPKSDPPAQEDPRREHAQADGAPGAGQGRDRFARRAVKFASRANAIRHAT
jgi:hypothetical protein